MSYNVLITAGPTREYLDPVRYITNESSGKMGYAIAEICEKKGWNVTLISGPVNIASPLIKGKTVIVKTAKEMLGSVLEYSDCDIAIFSAAVADYRPKVTTHHKIKKQGDELMMEFVKNPDIAAEFGRIKKNNQISVGFALETQNLLEYGEKKMHSKNLNAIALNNANEHGAGFGVDTNRISILNSNGVLTDFDLKPKIQVARDIVNFINDTLIKKKC